MSTLWGPWRWVHTWSLFYAVCSRIFAKPWQEWHSICFQSWGHVWPYRIGLDRHAVCHITRGCRASESNLCFEGACFQSAGSALWAVTIFSVRTFFILSVSLIAGIFQALGCFDLFWFLNLSGSLEKVVDFHIFLGGWVEITIGILEWLVDFSPVWSDSYLKTLKGNRMQGHDAEPDSRAPPPHFVHYSTLVLPS